MKLFNFLPVCCVLFVGCSSETISDRLYTQSIGITQNENLTLYAENFHQEISPPVDGISISELLRQEEALNGGKVFIGHTELLCLDGSCILPQMEELLFNYGLSPACKLLYTNPEKYFRNEKNNSFVHTIRMAEQNGLLAETELSTALTEWNGIGETALLPIQKENSSVPSLILLNKNGTCKELSSSAVQGMFWLRKNSGNFSFTFSTPEGEKQLFIRRCHIEKQIQNQHLLYHVFIRTNSSDENHSFQQLVEKQCLSAIQEMFSAHADVIGIQDILEKNHLPLEENFPPEMELLITVN